jgi:hypothetical protein
MNLLTGPNTLDLDRAVTSWESGRLATNLAATNSTHPYVSRLATRASLYADLQALLAAVREPVSRAEYRRHVIEENVLLRRTVAAREKTWKDELTTRS